MDATLDSEDITLLNQLSDKQKDYALTLYTAREKKKSTAYILWILFGVYYFYLGHPFKNILLWLLCFCSSEKSGGSWTSSVCPAW